MEPWFGMLMPDGRAVLGSRSREYAHGVAEISKAVAVIKIRFRTEAAERQALRYL